MSHNNNNQPRPKGRERASANKRGARSKASKKANSDPAAAKAKAKPAKSTKAKAEMGFPPGLPSTELDAARVQAATEAVLEAADPKSFIDVPIPVLPEAYACLKTAPVSPEARSENSEQRDSPDPVPRDCVNLGSFYSSRTITVNPADYPLRAFLVEIGEEEFVREGYSIGPHSISAACRLLATRMALSRGARMATPVPSLDFHGKLRGTFTIADLCGYTERTQKAALQPYGWTINVQNYGVSLFTQDNKYGERKMKYHQPADVAILVDVYALDPIEFLIMWDNCKAKVGYYMAQHFNGGDKCGANVYQGVFQAKKANSSDAEGKPIQQRDAPYFRPEGAWTVDDNGMMYWQASPTESMFPPHKLHFWNFFQKGHFEICGRKFTSYALGDRGPFRVWEFCEEKDAIAGMHHIAMPPSAAERKLMEVSSWRKPRAISPHWFRRWADAPARQFEDLIDSLGLGSLVDFFLPVQYIDVEAAAAPNLATLSKRKYAHNTISDMANIERAIAATSIGHASRRMRPLILDGVVPDYAKLAVHSTYKHVFGPERRAEAAAVVEHVRTSPEALENEERLRAAYADEAPRKSSWRRWLKIGVVVAVGAFVATRLWKRAGVSGLISGKLISEQTLSEAVGAAREGMLALPKNEWFSHHNAGAHALADWVTSLFVPGTDVTSILKHFGFFAGVTASHAIAEEIGKKYLPMWLTVPLFASETFMNYLIAGRGAFVTAGMHAVTYALGRVNLGSACFVHTAYNILVSGPCLVAASTCKLPLGMLPTFLGPALGALGLIAAYAKPARYEDQGAFMRDLAVRRYDVEEPMDSAPSGVATLSHASAMLPRTDNLESGEIGRSVFPLPTHIDKAFTMKLEFEDKSIVLDHRNRAGFYEVYERLAVASFKDPRPVYLLMANNGLPHVPSNDDCSKFLAIVQRLAKCPYEGAPPKQKEVAQAIALEFDLLLGASTYEECSESEKLQDFKADHVSRTHTVEEFWGDIMRSMGTKGKRYARFEADLEKGYECRQDKITINFKSNESIARKLMGGFRVLVGRVIWNITLEELFNSVPLTRDMSVSAHRVFALKRRFLLFSGIHGCVVPIMIFWAAGMKPEISIAFWEEVRHCRETDCVFIRINGDDTQIMWFFMPSRQLKTIVLNGDFSKFDQTQRWAFMYDHLAGRFLPLLADATLYRAENHIIPSQEIRVYFKQSKVKATLLVDPQMSTGDSKTSLGSFGNALPFCLKTIRMFGVETPDEVAKSFGFNFKSEWGSPEDSAFLKMWPVPVYLQDGRAVFLDMSLPGAVCKLGKSLISPASMRLKGERRYELGSRAYQVAIEDMARAMAMSYGNVPFNYPILGPYLEKMLSFSTKTAEELAAFMPREFDDGFREKIPFCQLVSREEILARTCNRYGTTVAQILEVERLISRVKRLPAFISHDLFETMSRVDYG
jgi:hypothetical protein